MTGPGLRLAVVLALVGGAVVLGSGPAAATDGPHDVPLTAEVTGTTSSIDGPTSGELGADAAGGPARGPVDPTQVFPGAATPSAQPAATSTAAPASDKHSVDGVLAVGGLRTTFRSTGSPLGGVLHVQVTVQNLSGEVITPSVRFTSTNWLGMRLAQQPERRLGPLAPGELRTAEADLPGVGQWGLLATHMTVTPPDEIGGVKVSPVTRDRWVVVTPWLLVALLAIGVGGTVVWRLATRVQVPGPAAEVVA